MQISIRKDPSRPCGLKFYSSETGEELSVMSADIRYRPEEVVTANLTLFVNEVEHQADVNEPIIVMLPDGNRYTCTRIVDAPSD